MFSRTHVSEPWKTHLETAKIDWNQSVVLELSIVFIPPKQQSCRPKSGVIVVCNGAFGSNGVRGSAQIWVKGSHITQAVVRLNDTYMFSGESGTTHWRQYVMCQELGHALGLNHQDENNFNAPLFTCMDYQATLTDPREEHPNTHDYDALEKIYTPIQPQPLQVPAPSHRALSPATAIWRIRHSGAGWRTNRRTAGTRGTSVTSATTKK